MTEPTGQLWLPRQAKEAEFKKAAPPKTGPAFGSWAGRDLSYLQLPGGAVLQFDLSRLTLQDFRQMRDHYQVNASLSILTFMMHQLDWHIEGGSSKQRTFVEENLRSLWTRLIRAISQAYWAGYSPIVIEWANNAQTQRVEVDKFKDLVPEECAVNWKVTKGFAPEGHARPTFYDYDGIIQKNTSGFPIPPENTLWYPLLMENGDHYGRKLLRPAFPSWFFSILMHLFSNRYFERFGEPLPVGRADFEDEVLDSDGNYITGRQAMENILTNLRNRAVVVLPSDRVPVGDGSKSEYAYDIEYLESQMRGADFERYLTRLDEEISLSIFTPLLMLRTADVGSYNLGTTHAQVYLWMLNALAGDMKEYIDRRVVQRLNEYNFGTNAPKLQWMPRKLGKENVETFRSIVTELLRNGKIKPDIDELGQAIGLSFSEVREVTEPPAPPEPPDPTADPRVGRPGRIEPTDGPKSVGDPQRTGRKISARIRSQFDKARREGALSEYVPDLGYRRQMEDEVGSPETVERFYERMNAWTKDAAPTFVDATTEAFMETFDRVLELELAEV